MHFFSNSATSPNVHLMHFEETTKKLTAPFIIEAAIFPPYRYKFPSRFLGTYSLSYKKIASVRALLRNFVIGLEQQRKFLLLVIRYIMFNNVRGSKM